MIRPAALPVPIPVVIPVIVAAMTLVRPEHLKTTPVLMPPRPNAVPAVTGVKTAHPEKLTGTALMSDLPNAEAAIHVPIPVLPVPVAGPAARPVMTRFMSARPNAVPAVMDVRSIITLIPVRAVIRLQTALVLTGMIPSLNPVLVVRQAGLVTNAIRTHIVILVRPDIQHRVPTDIPIRLQKLVLAGKHPGLVISARQLRPVLPDIQEQDVPITILCEFYRRMKPVVAAGYVLTDGMIVGAVLVKENAKMQVITAKKWKDAFRVRYVTTGCKINKADDIN